MVAIATIEVTPGALLEVYVGGNPTEQLGVGGYNGGGAINALPCGGGSDGWPGGGASDVRTTSSLEDRIIVAGGGGGQGYSNGLGGAGGGQEGIDGEDSWIVNTQGLSGNQLTGGIAGAYNGEFAENGALGVGGNGGPESGYCIGGAGGGGYYGGGGGYVSAGGGGSSYIDSPGSSDASTASDVQTGHGQIIIYYFCDLLSVDSYNDSICEGEQIILNASGLGEISWDNDVINGYAFAPEVGTTIYNATSTDINDCLYSAEITVLDGINITYISSDEILGDDGSINITVTGGNSIYLFDWSNDGTGDFDDTEDLTELTNDTYTVVVQDEAGCSSTETIVLGSGVGINEIVENSVSVYPNPTSNQIRISLAGYFDYNILNLNGETIYSGSGVDYSDISLKEYTIGTYFIKICSNEKVSTVKVVKR